MSVGAHTGLRLHSYATGRFVLGTGVPWGAVHPQVAQWPSEAMGLLSMGLHDAQARLTGTGPKVVIAGRF
jgi:hypothetical protein